MELLLQSKLREADRVLARYDFWEFCKYLSPDFYTDERKHLRIICDTLQALYEGRIVRQANEWVIVKEPAKTDTVCKKLMLNVPPQHGKSRTLINFSCWIFGRNPKEKIISTAYNDKVASDFGRYTRDNITANKITPDDPVYADIFPNTKLKYGNSSFEKWALEGSHFSYLTAGIGGSLTSKGGTVLIVDDPVKDAEESLNENALERAWLWYTSTFLSRVSANEGEPIEIICMTRWSSRDICGKILDGQTAKDWYVLKMEAYDEKNDTMLCDSLLSKKRYLDQKMIMFPPIFRANYHQESVEATGLLFPRASLKRYSLKQFRENEEALRKHGNYDEYKLGYCDVADDGADALALVIGNLKQKKVFITDVIYNTANVDITRPQTLALLHKEKPKYCRIETNNQGSVFTKWIHQDKPLETTILPVPTHTNKNTRILMQQGFITEFFYFLNEDEIIPGSDYDLFMRNLTAYMKDGSSKHDDAPDATSGLAQLIQSLNLKIFNG